MKPALLVIDVQQQFFNPGTADSLNSAIEHINAAIALFREKGYPVVAVQHTDPNTNLVPGKAGFDLPESLDILPSDLHIHKTYSNSFNKTPLAEKLREQGVDTVIVTGYCAEYCVLSGFRGAQDVDLNAVILLGAMASPIAEHITFVENITDTISLGELRTMLAR